MITEVYYEYSGTDYRLFPFDGSVSYRNVWGNCCKEVTALAPNQQGFQTPIPGRYRVTFDRASVDAYNSALEICHLNYEAHSSSFESCISALPNVIVYVDCPLQTNNPNINLTGISVDVKSGNDNRNIIPGLSINLCSFPAYYHCFDIIVGGFWIAEEERYYSVLSFGNFLAGVSSTDITLKIKNVSGTTLTDCYAYILNKVCLSQSEMGNPIFSIYQRGEINPVSFDSLTEKEITFDNLTSGKIDILVDDETEAVFDVEVETEYSAGRGLECDGTTVYQFGDGTDYSGIAFILSSDLVETDTANLLVSPGGDVWDIRISGASEWTKGTSGIDLGDLEIDEEIEIDIKLSPMSYLTDEMNPFQGILQIVSGDNSDSIGLIGTIFPNSDRSLLLRVSIHEVNDYETMMDFGVSS